MLYGEENGWGGTYEALAAEIIAQYIKTYGARRERFWIAEKDGERVGGVFVAKASDDVVKLRLLHVEPDRRNLGTRPAHSGAELKSSGPFAGLLGECGRSGAGT